ncbi:unnamed protein product [Prunus armeniaca]
MSPSTMRDSNFQATESNRAAHGWHVKMKNCDDALATFRLYKWRAEQEKKGTPSLRAKRASIERENQELFWLSFISMSS